MKIKIIGAILCLCLFGCNSEPNHKPTSVPCTDDVKVPASTFEYNGHKYIKFQYAVTFAGDSGTVHDPDCPCMKGKK
jgi:hypothetical protein